MSRNHPIPEGRVLPPVFKKAIELDYHQKFTCLQRLQILCGYNLDLKLRLTTEHSPGRIATLFDVQTTNKL